MFCEFNSESSNYYALGREAFKRYMLAQAHGQPEVAALYGLISTFQSGVAKCGQPWPRKS